MRYEIKISLRYLFSRKRKRFISFMSLVSILGVAVGVTCLITVLAVMNGFGHELQKRIIGSNPHLIIEKQNGITFKDYNTLREAIDNTEHVKGSYPFIWGQGVLQYRSRAQGVVIRSVDTENRSDTSKIAPHIYSGSLNLSDGEIVIGNELSIALGAFVGDSIDVITSASGRLKKFKVKGIFNSGMYEYDLNLGYVNIKTASRLFGMGDNLNGIGVDIESISDTSSVKERLTSLMPQGYYVRTWMDLNRNLFSALKLEKWAMFIILTLIVIVAALNIISTLTVMVTEKTKDIGILKSIGATKKIIMVLFSLQGAIIGLIGVTAGVLGGIGLSLLLKKFRFPVLPESIYYGINYLPVRIDIWDSLIIAGSALMISLLASIYPAYQASRLNPVDALRYE